MTSPPSSTKQPLQSGNHFSLPFSCHFLCHSNSILIHLPLSSCFSLQSAHVDCDSHPRTCTQAAVKVGRTPAPGAKERRMERGRRGCVVEGRWEVANCYERRKCPNVPLPAGSELIRCVHPPWWEWMSRILHHPCSALLYGNDLPTVTNFLPSPCSHSVYLPLSPSLSLFPPFSLSVSLSVPLSLCPSGIFLTHSMCRVTPTECATPRARDVT